MRDEIYVRVEQRPTMPPFLAFALLIGLIMGAGMAFKFAVENALAILSFGLAPLVVWFAYGRRQYRRGNATRAVLVTLAIPFVLQGAFKLMEWRNEVNNAAWAKAQFTAPCHAQFIDRKPVGTGPIYRFDLCASYLPRQQAVNLCKPWIQRGGRFPDGWAECSRFVDAVVPLPSSK